MYYSVSYDVIACDDFVPETVTRTFDSIFDAVDYWADCKDTESNCVLSSASLNDEADDLPF